MTSLWTQGWFIWCLVVVLLLPLLSVALSELQATLDRRRSPMARPVYLLRAVLLPLAALLVLILVIPDDVIANDSNWFKVTATAVGFLLLNFALQGINTALFHNAQVGSWRRKLPTIFIDIGRIVVIAIGLAMIFSLVWGADVGGLFTALGVTSVVIGLALQNAVGSIVAGLLLLFEQPFELGDWLEYGGVTGRVVEVNWRAVHIQVGDGLQIVPNSSLAGGAFTNLSRPDATFTDTIETSFAGEDEPVAVMQTLLDVARGIPEVQQTPAPGVAFLGSGTYAISLTLLSYGDAARARAEFRLRLWYAARRRNLRLEGADIWKGESREDVVALLREAAPRLHVDESQVEQLGSRLDIERFAPGEIVEFAGVVPNAVRWIAVGRVAIVVPFGDGRIEAVELGRGDLLGHASLVRMPATYASRAVTSLTVLTIPAAVFEEMVRANVRLGREIGREMDQRAVTIEQALATTDRRISG